MTTAAADVRCGDNDGNIKDRGTISLYINDTICTWGSLVKKFDSSNLCGISYWLPNVPGSFDCIIGFVKLALLPGTLDLYHQYSATYVAYMVGILVPHFPP